MEGAGHGSSGQSKGVTPPFALEHTSELERQTRRGPPRGHVRALGSPRWLEHQQIACARHGEVSSLFFILADSLPKHQSITSDKHHGYRRTKVPKITKYVYRQTWLRQKIPSPKNSTNENRSSCLYPANLSLSSLTASRTEMQNAVPEDYRFAEIMPDSQTPLIVPAHLLAHSRSSESMVWAIVLYCHVPPSTFLN